LTVRVEAGAFEALIVYVAVSPSLTLAGDADTVSLGAFAFVPLAKVSPLQSINAAKTICQ